MKLREYDVVRLKQDIPGHNLRKGDIGTIVVAYEPSSKDYEVEFCDTDGVTIALVTLNETILEKIEV
jgi:hypothetical protein